MQANAGEPNLRRRNANQDNVRESNARETAPSPESSTQASSSATATSTASRAASTSPAATNAQENRTRDGKVYYQGQTYDGTGRLPRDAPFTPTYVNAYTVNSAIAFVSLIVTGTFFYFKIIVGLLESPQIGPDREFLVQMSGMGPADAGEPRTLWTPNCPSASTTIQMNTQETSGQEQGAWTGNNNQEDDCALFGKIVVLADSISKYGYTHATYGWLGFLSDEWVGRADVVLRSFPEYNTHWVNSLFPELLYQESKGSTPVKLVIIALGTDDASFAHTRQHVALDAYKDNLKAIVNAIRFPESPNYSPHTNVILVTPAPVDDTMWEASLTAVNQTMNRSNSVTKEYAQACVEVGKALNIPVVDLWSEIHCQVEGTCELHESDQLQDYFMDGLHLKRMGNEVLYKSVMDAVARHYPHLHPTCWPSVFPGYAEGSSPEQSALERRCRSRQ
ncbi:hypothetical protein BGZ67_009193 [Mortierella alpina]|nr:hypothetical protein BGZ67_009193 [Mortierella alpina]